MAQPSITIFFVANQTPMVGLLSETKDSFTNILRRVLLPTDASPIRIYLKIQSQSRLFSITIINVYISRIHLACELIKRFIYFARQEFSNNNQLHSYFYTIFILLAKMLKERITIVDINKKQKLVSEEQFYQKVKLVGQGTFGKVYLAKSKQDGRQWALKQVLQDKRYKNRELGIMARIEHCNIMTMKQYFLKLVRDECYLSIIMEYVPSSLNVMIKQQRKIKKPFPLIIRKLIIFQMLKALYYMELTKVCHRDLKPPNILINDKTFELKICDFGSAKILEKEESNVSYICSRYYRAPELVMQATDYSTEIDTWSAGCIFVQLLTLEPIFPGDSSQEQLIQIIKILGTPPLRYLQMYQAQKNMQYKMPIIKANPWQVVLHKYEPQKQLIDIIQNILTYNAKERMRPIDGLKHPYFLDLATYTSYIQKLPQLFYFGDLQNLKNARQIEQLQKMYPQPEPEYREKKPTKSLQETVKIQKTPNTTNE